MGSLPKGKFGCCITQCDLSFQSISFQISCVMRTFLKNLSTCPLETCSLMPKPFLSHLPQRSRHKSALPVLWEHMRWLNLEPEALALPSLTPNGFSSPRPWFPTTAATDVLPASGACRDGSGVRQRSPSSCLSLLLRPAPAPTHLGGFSVIWCLRRFRWSSHLLLQQPDCEQPRSRAWWLWHYILVACEAQGPCSKDFSLS